MADEAKVRCIVELRFTLGLDHDISYDASTLVLRVLVIPDSYPDGFHFSGGWYRDGDTSTLILAVQMGHSVVPAACPGFPHEGHLDGLGQAGSSGRRFLRIDKVPSYSAE
ncbi:hypothetical protein OUZ56_017677 [Daphnia magna]|uniref:Uncharacterized protein n=1 Tax=Daphnia magna TaxID=35525 RepID=A0ABQ9Z8F6_9CRUS|nr:hypothetical protein OUZ56_018241 [Daphnia magna]KAK4028397.1 hypothetical protein OUZ56_017677 [Daphnia magna]